MTGFAKFLSRFFIFLMSCLAVSVFVFWFKEPHDSGPFIEVVRFGIPAWAGLNISERVFVDRIKALNGKE